MSPPSTRRIPTPAAVHVVPWTDPLVESTGVDPRSAYVELFWLPVLGPSATLLVRRLADELDRSPDGCEVDLGLVARSLGVGGTDSRHAPLLRALRRCARFGVLRAQGPEEVAVRRMLGPLPQHHLARLPEPLRQRHIRWEQPPSAAEAARHRARLLAVDALALDGVPLTVERRLTAWGVHPALAYESARWASAQVAVPGAVPGAETLPSRNASSVRTPNPVPPLDR
ncbi:MAG: hypothetical protein ACRDYZ_16075 [Acidimicrobiales bacterium]